MLLQKHSNRCCAYKMCHHRRFYDPFRLFLLSLVRTPTRILLIAFYLIILFISKDLLRVLLWDSWTFYHRSPGHERELLQIHVVFKHGHRAPFRLYETDPNPKKLWVEGLGALTTLGRLQMYTMGQHLRERYSGLLTADPNEVYVQSSEAARSLYSAYSFLAGFYPPDEEWAFADLPWQPIEVLYVPETDERYLQSNPNCPKYEISKKNTANSEEVQEFIKKHKWFYDYWHGHSKKHIGTYDGAGDLFKTLSVERDMNLTIPDWALKYWDELVHQADMGYFYHFKTKLQQRLRAGPILGLMLERMKDRIEGRNHSIKAYLYSGHGSNIAAIQCALQSYDMKHTPHAGTLVQELYWEKDGFYSTRFLFFNSSHPVSNMESALALHLHGCPKEFCPVDIYEEFIRDLVPEDWDQECQEEDISEEITPIQYATYVIR